MRSRACRSSGQLFDPDELTKRGWNLGFETRLGRPGRNRASQQEIFCLIPVRRFGRGQREGGRRPVLLAAQRDGRAALGIIGRSAASGAATASPASQAWTSFHCQRCRRSRARRPRSSRSIEASRFSGSGTPLVRTWMRKACSLMPSKHAPLGDPLQQDHPQTPPVRGRCHSARNRLGRHVARRLQRRGDIEIEFRKARGAEAADDEIQRIPGAHENRRRGADRGGAARLPTRE